MSFGTFSTLASTSYLSPYGDYVVLSDSDHPMIQCLDRRGMLEERDARGHRRCPAISIAHMEEMGSSLLSSSCLLNDSIDVEQDYQSNICLDLENTDYFGHPNIHSPTSSSPSPSIQCLARNFSYKYAESDEAFRFTPSPLASGSPLLSLSVCQALPVLGRRKVDAAFPVPPCSSVTRRSYTDDDKENVAPRKQRGRRSGRISV